MTIADVLIYAFLALLYGAIATGLVLGILRFVWPQTGIRLAPFLFLTLTFIALTQHPFPAPGTLVCPKTSGEPQLQPFLYWKTVRHLWNAGNGPLDWILNRTTAATAMNFLIPAAIGAALAQHRVSFGAALALAVTLTLAVELTQLTGIWGIYPCAYRQFNVDDLMLNSLGLIAGFVLARRFVFAGSDHPAKGSRGDE